MRRRKPEGQAGELMLASWHSPPVNVLCSSKLRLRLVVLSGSDRCLAVLTIMVCCGFSYCWVPPEFCLVPKFPEKNSLPVGNVFFFSRSLCQEDWEGL